MASKDKDNDGEQKPKPRQVVVTHYGKKKREDEDIPTEIIPQEPTHILSSPVDIGFDSKATAPSATPSTAPKEEPKVQPAYVSEPHVVSEPKKQQPYIEPEPVAAASASEWQPRPASEEKKRMNDDIPPEQKSSRGFPTFWLLFFLAGLIVLGYYAYNMQQQLDQIQEQNAQDTNQVKNLTVQAKQSLMQLDKQKQEDVLSKQQLQSLKTEVVDAQSQLVKLKQSSDWALAEANYLTFMANMRIKSANDVQTALVQLTAADDRLREVGNPGLDWVRATLAKDIARLKSMPQVNRQVLWEQIEALSNSFYQLHFKRLDEALKQQDDVKIDTNLPAWRQALMRSWAELKGLIKVTKQEQNSVPLALSIQEQSQIMRTMQLLSMQAQWALLEGQDKIYQGSLKALHGWLEKYFESTEIQKNMLSQIQELESQQIALAIPDVDASIQALAQAMKSQNQNVKKDIKS